MQPESAKTSGFEARRRRHTPAAPAEVEESRIENPRRHASKTFFANRCIFFIYADHAFRCANLA